MDTRPKIAISLTPTDKILEVIGASLLITLWGVVIWKYPGLPETIPIHFNAGGVADGYGGKSVLLMLSLAATMLYGGLTYLNRFPHAFNYLVKITEENARRQYMNATKMMRWMKLSVALIFGVLVWGMIEVVHGRTTGLSDWFMPAVLVLLFVPIIYFNIRAYQKK